MNKLVCSLTSTTSANDFKNTAKWSFNQPNNTLPLKHTVPPLYLLSLNQYLCKTNHENLPSVLSILSLKPLLYIKALTLISSHLASLKSDNHFFESIFLYRSYFNASPNYELYSILEILDPVDSCGTSISGGDTMQYNPETSSPLSTLSSKDSLKIPPWKKQLLCKDNKEINVSDLSINSDSENNNLVDNVLLVRQSS